MPGIVAPDLAVPIRATLLAIPSVTSQLATYLGAPAIFTRRPAPPESGFPMIMISGNIAKTDQDGVDDNRPIITRDVAIYGLNDNPNTYRNVEVMGDLVYQQFHHARNVLTLDPTSISQGWTVVDIHCGGPTMAPTEDDLYVGRVVTLRINLANFHGD